MAEDITNFSTEEIAIQNIESRSNSRIKELSDKVELTAKERDEAKELREQDQKKIQELERESAFNSGFIDMLTSHPGAKDHKDEIKQKVLSGYSVEDATFAVLGKAGKLGTAQAVATQSPAGGSASNTITAQEKSIKDMNQAERRAILEKELFWQ